MPTRSSACSWLRLSRTRFNLEIDDETLLSLNSVADAVDAIENAREA